MAKNSSAKFAGYSDEVKLLIELERKREEILPELKDCVVRSPTGLLVHHPLVVCEFVSKGRFAYANHVYREKKAAAEKALQERDCVTYVLLHERPYQATAMVEVADHFEDDSTFWDLLGDLYTDSENPWQHPDEWRRLLHSERTNRQSIMTAEEKDYLDGLPTELTIYRGFAFTNRDGWSWTLDRAKAEWFAHRFAELGGFPQAVIGSVQKNDVIAYFNRRNEEEILVDPDRVEIAKAEPLVELQAVNDEELKNATKDVGARFQSWISSHPQSTVGDLAAYLHKAELQCLDFVERGDPAIYAVDSIPVPLKEYLDEFNDHEGEEFSTRLESLNEDQEVLQEFLRVVGPNHVLSDSC